MRKITIVAFFAVLFFSSAVFTSIQAQAEPIINMNCPPDPVWAGDQLVMSVSVERPPVEPTPPEATPPDAKPADAKPADAKPPTPPKYEWTISDGRIERGQGTPSITIRTERTTTGVSAMVDITNLSSETVTLYCAAMVTPRPEARFVGQTSALESAEIEAKLDELFTQLQMEPDAQGYVFIHPSSIKERTRVEQSIQERIKAREFDKTRITIVRKAINKRNAIQIWVVPANADNPKGDLSTTNDD